MPVQIKNKDTGETILNFAGESLRYRNLRNVSFINADLRNVDFTGSDLRFSCFIDADLSGAIMKDTNIHFADFLYANMTDVDLTGSDMFGINLSNTNMKGVKFDPEIPIIEKIDAKILDAIQQEGNGLDMENWHTCGTTHCRGGWAIVLAGDAGITIQQKFGLRAAASLIYAASRPDKPIPNFFTTNEKAMADIIACAAE